MDNITTLGRSTIQHGPESRRIYLMNLHPSDFPLIIDKIEMLANKHHYTKIFAKVPAHMSPSFLAAGYSIEAFVPHFFHQQEDALFMVRYLDPQRSLPDPAELMAFQKLLKKEETKELNPLKTYQKIRILNKHDIDPMIKLFGEVFESYPFPIFDPAFLEKSMSEGTIYFGLFQKEELAGISSAECNSNHKHAEMTDFAVHPTHRGKCFATHLLRAMEDHLTRNHYNTFYTIARLKSLSMNKTFMNHHYRFSGTLINNTQIAGNIESMNVWYKTV